jgi:hypothetical protein
MKNKPKKVYERVYIHAAKVRTTEGWVLVIHTMDAMSEFAFKPVFGKTTEIDIDVLNQLFDNILEGYQSVIHPKQITFVTNLPEEYSNLFQQTKAVHHRFKFNKEATTKAMKSLLSTLRHNFVEL